MTKYQALNRKMNTQLFLIMYFFIKIYEVFSYTYFYYNNFDSKPIRNTFFCIFLAILLFINISAYKTVGKIRYHKTSKVFAAGYSLWISWGVFTAITGLSFLGLDIIGVGWYVYDLLKIIFAVNVITVLKQKKNFLRIVLFGMGMVIFMFFIANFDGFGFLGSITHILSKGDRYRFDYGFGHVNYSGAWCGDYFILMAIYRGELQDEHIKNVYKDKFYLCFLFLSPAVLMVLLSSATRASITGLFLFWLTSYIEEIYDKITRDLKIVCFLLLLFTAVIIAMNINWQFMYDLSGRASNYTYYLPLITRTNSWLTGIGMVRAGNIVDQVSSSGTALDGHYLLTLLETGVIGFCIFEGTIFYVLLSYVKKVGSMTNSQRLTAACLVYRLWRGLFESHMTRGYSAPEMWILIILSFNEMVSAKNSNPSFTLSKSRLKTENLLHNS